MLLSEREKITEGNVLSIGITPGGVRRTSIGVPWERTVHAYNMRTPTVYLAPEDLHDEEILNLIGQCRVIGCYIWAPMTDYSFLRKFSQLEDLYIKNGDAIRELDFLSGLTECRMFYLQNAQLQNLQQLLQAKKESKAPFGGLRCVALDRCRVADLTALAQEPVNFSEFLVFAPMGQKEHWEGFSIGGFRYYEYKK